MTITHFNCDIDEYVIAAHDAIEQSRENVVCVYGMIAMLGCTDDEAAIALRLLLNEKYLKEVMSFDCDFVQSLTHCIHYVSTRELAMYYREIINSMVDYSEVE